MESCFDPVLVGIQAIFELLIGDSNCVGVVSAVHNPVSNLCFLICAEPSCLRGPLEHGKHFSNADLSVCVAIISVFHGEVFDDQVSYGRVLVQLAAVRVPHCENSDLISPVHFFEHLGDGRHGVQ